MRLNEIVGSHYDQFIRTAFSIPVANKNIEAFRDFFDTLEEKYQGRGVKLAKQKRKNRLIFKVFPIEIDGPFITVRRIVNEICSFLEEHAWSEGNANYYDEFCKQMQQSLNDQALQQEKEYAEDRGHIRFENVSVGANTARDDPTIQDPPPKIRKTERMRKKLRQMKRRTPPGGTIRTTDEKYPHGSGMFSGMF